MNSYGYLFREFQDQVVDVANTNDPIRQQIEAVAKENGLTVKFNKVGGGMGGACVMPPDNQVTINLAQGTDNKWRVLPSMF